MLTINMKTDTAAFVKDGHSHQTRSECARILRVIARKMDLGKDRGVIYDLHENDIGTYKLTNE